MKVNSVPWNLFRQLVEHSFHSINQILMRCCITEISSAGGRGGEKRQRGGEMYL